jgi:hypothetical protein
MPQDMQTVRFYADEGRPQTLHVETDGAVVNIRVGLRDSEGRPVTAVQISPDDETRGGDGHGRVWRLAEDGYRVIREAHPDDDQQGADEPDGSGMWSLVTTVAVDDDQLCTIGELVAAGNTSGDIPGPGATEEDA